MILIILIMVIVFSFGYLIGKYKGEKDGVDFCFDKWKDEENKNADSN